MKRQLLWFGVVGISALVVHYLMVTAVLTPLGLAPLVANIAAFLVAFQVSYWGHRHLTFGQSGVSHRHALPRFFGVACLSFAVNEGLYALLLRFTALDYRVSLLIVLFAVAALTFVLSKLWAFRARSLA
ncbi:MAG: GtrA family protein [Paludibacterium sp.]|uniref:GtrA family protein n=1 Tax=Paludibacterium sp. TaxID=1917523 RepID=UPI0025D1136D|nr:GtrA family protein [Paludibacterium sp.]MBV8045735.1 GtrA family protein [Paludibacterium sp.]MBV8648066.1 GtrA family protein [Paludibacterium sp.]